MTCPKCHGDMRSSERNGRDGRSFYSEPAKPRPDERGGYGDYSHHGKPYKKRKKHFLEERFD